MDPEQQRTELNKQLQEEGGQKLSKGQKKKLREQKKKQELLKQSQNKGEEEEKIQPKKQEKKDEAKKGKKGKGNAAALLAKKKLEEHQKFEDQQERKRKEFEEQQERLRKEEQERLRKEKEEKQKFEKEKQEEIKNLKGQGLYMSKKQKQKMERARQQFQMQKKRAQEEENAQGYLEGEQKVVQKSKKKQESKILRDDREIFALKQGNFRSPVCCILGHVDTGKTTLLDKIRKTNVQEGEAGGITQQIGATFFPQSKLQEQIEKCKNILPVDVNVPGLLIIDTPGHESFSNLRSRGSSLCDIAILVIDIQHGIENQTLQSLQILKKGETPFVVALNKIDRSYNWETFIDNSSYQSLKKQKPETFNDYKTKLDQAILQLNQKGYNAALYWQNEEPQDYISLVPTSGITGEGIPDLLAMIVNNSLYMKNIRKRIKIKKDKFKCTVMEVKMIEGYGTTIDCLLVDGLIKKQDQIVLLGFDGPIVTKVKAVLTPKPMKQMRIKDQYLHHDYIHAANGVKIAANNLDQAIAGSPLIVANSPDEVEDAINFCEDQLLNIKSKFKLEALGVGVAASTLGSLEALLQYLKTQKIPVSHISVGPVSREDVIKAMKSMLSEIPEKRKQQYACLLAFDVKILADAQKYAEQNHIKIFTANIIYHLTDYFTKHVLDIKQKRKQKEGKQAVFPCILKQVRTIRKCDPIILGVDVEYGVIKIGTPIAVYKPKQKSGQKILTLGTVESIEFNKKKINEARKKNGSVAIQLGGDPSLMSGRHFEQTDKLASVMTRRSIDCLKEHFKEEVSKDEWGLVVELKKYFNVI